MTTEAQEKAADYLVSASANLIDALMVVLGTPLEHEIRSYLQDLYKVEARVRG